MHGILSPTTLNKFGDRSMTTIIAGESAKFTVDVLSDDAPGARWNDGIITVELTVFETEAFPAGDLLLIIRGGFGQVPTGSYPSVQRA